MEKTVRIVHPFHRFVFVEKGQPERREAFALNAVVTVSAEDAEDWIAKGLAVEVEKGQAVEAEQ